MRPIPGEDPDQPLPPKSRLLLLAASVAVVAGVVYFLIDAVIG